tara:strand:- start:157 stop:2136 length:1980 start_codon:yes stop_codon:yes gene_type:complete
MKTRSKNQVTSDNDVSSDVSSEISSDVSELSSDLDEYGNIKGLIDYGTEDTEGDFDQVLFDNEIARLSGNRKSPKNINKKIKKIKKSNNLKKIKSPKKGDGKGKLNDIFMSYLIMKATEKANLELKENQSFSKKKIRKSKIKVSEEPNEINVSEEPNEINEINEINLGECEVGEGSLITILTANFPDTGSSDNGSSDESFSSLDKSSSDPGTPELESDKSSDNEEDEEDEEDFTYEYDELDEQYEELIDKQLLLNTDESNMEYYHYLSTGQKETLLRTTREIYEINGSNTPLRFKVIQSEMAMSTKAIALENIDKMSEMEVSTGEHSKMDHWINGLMKIPFGKYRNIPVTHDNSIDVKRNYIKDTYQTLNKAIYGHKEAKTHILQVIGKWIKNPESGGNVLAIQGPMGNGKTTLVKDGISKVLNRPFAFIALGGASDSAYFDGHCFTYEGSHWGRIIQILQEAKCMNPIIYFDELDKISDTTKGEEIVHLLTHLTDPSQNSLFQDNYFPGVNIDLSKVLFIFSYNDESKVNRILKDRMYVIHTKGFNTEDKLKICNEYLIPEIFDTFAFNQTEIIFSNEIIKDIIQDFTYKEEGVRNLKRCIETIISKINIHILSEGDEALSFKLPNFTLPVTLDKSHIDILLKEGFNEQDKPPFGMYC